jgi:hypothetical protein
LRPRIGVSVPLLAAVCLFLAAPPAAGFGKNKITYERFDWQVYKSPHFNVHYYPEMEPFLEEIVSYAESAYLEISRKLDHELRFRVQLVAYKTHGEFEQTNITLSEVGEGVGAFAEPIQNRMVLPIDLPPDKLYQLIGHELTHIFQYSIFYDGYIGRALRSNPPTWLMEGLASYLGNDEDNFDRMAIRDAVVNNILPPIEALSQVTFLTYRYGHAIFDYIEQEYGEEGLRSFLFEYRKVLLTGNVERAMREAFGHDLDDFDRKFNRYLRKKYFPVLLEKKGPDEYGTEIGVREPGVFTFSPNISPSGELVAVLSTPKMELDLLVLSAEDGSTVKNLTAGWTNEYRGLVTEIFSGKRDLSWSPSADHIAVFGRKENTWPLMVFHALSGRKLHHIPLRGIVENASPAYSPDGRKVAFEGNRNGVVDIFEIDLQTREVRNLTQDDFFDANPWYSADGSTLLYNRRIGAHWKIFSVEVDDQEKKTQLTFGTTSEIQPSLSRDGRTVFYASDAGPDGVFNIYSLDLQTGHVKQYTDVVGGCFAPVEMAERAGDPSLVFTSYYQGTFRLYRMTLTDPVAEIPIEERMAEPAEAQEFVPPLSLRLDEPQKAPYKLKWDVEAPYVQVGVTDDGTFLADAGISFSDLLGNHRLQVTATSVSEFANFSVAYFNVKRRFDWGGTVFDFHDFIVRDEDTPLTSDLENRTWGFNAFYQYPFNRYYRVDLSAGALENSQDFLGFDPNTGQTVVASFTDRFVTLSASLSGDTTRFQSFGPFQGKRFELGVFHAPHLSGDVEGDITEYTLDFRAYRQVTRRSLLAFRAATIQSVGDRWNSYGFGGLNQLRGYGYRDYIGSRLAWANLEFRFPLIEELHFPILSLAQIRGFFFADVGAAWYADSEWYDPATQSIRVRPDGLQFVAVPFDFWDSDSNQLQDGRASYGTGFQFLFLGGLQLNWIWAKRFAYMQYDPLNDLFVKVDDSRTRQEFYIVFDF